MSARDVENIDTATTVRCANSAASLRPMLTCPVRHRQLQQLDVTSVDMRVFMHEHAQSPSDLYRLNEGIEMTEPNFVESDIAPLVDADLLEEIVCALVTHPEDVRIEETVENTKTVLKIFVNPEDNGLVIGRKGATVKVLRSLFAIIASKEKKDWPMIEVMSGPKRVVDAAE